MKWWLVLPLAAALMWFVNEKVDTQAHRITQLEMALAQAHAEADTLEAMLREGD